MNRLSLIQKFDITVSKFMLLRTKEGCGFSQQKVVKKVQETSLNECKK